MTVWWARRAQLRKVGPAVPGTSTRWRSSSTVEAWENGTQIYHVTTATLGTDPVLNVQLGNEIKGQTYTLAADNIEITDGSAIVGPVAVVADGDAATPAVAWIDRSKLE